MQVYYNILEMIRTQLLGDVNVNTVTTGDIFDVDLDKQTIFPLSHVMVNQATRKDRVYTLNISVLLMDIVDKVNHEATDKFRGNDNEQDVFNTQLSVGGRLVEMLKRGDLREDNFELTNDPNFEPFTERFENSLAGWALTFDVDVPNTMTVCDVPIVPPSCLAADYSIIDEDGNVLYSGSIASGGSLEQEIQNSTAIVKNSEGTTQSTTSILAEGTETITANDTLVSTKNSLGTVIDGSSYPSGTANNLVLPDIPNVDSDGSTVNTPAQVPFVCTPAAPPTPQLYQAAKVMQTGQLISFTTGDDITRGRSIDFFTLDYVNEWGHSFRFCGSNGGYTDGTSYFNVLGVATTRALAFPDLIIFDFSARNVNSILSYYIGDLTSGNQSDQILRHLTSNIGGFNNWNLWNFSEALNILNVGVFPVTTHFVNYPPFDFGSSNRYYWTSSSYNATQGFRVDLRGTSPMSAGNVSSSILGIWVRYTTLAELGL